MAGQSRVLSDRNYGLLLVLPTTIVLVLIIIFPLGYSLYLSFVSLNLLRPGQGSHFVGLLNYLRVVTDPLFDQSLLRTLAFVVGTLTVELAYGLLVAILLNRADLKGRGAFRTLLLFPLMIAPIVSGLQWRWILADQYGVLNYLLHVVGLPAPVWLGEPVSAMAAIFIANFWVSTPFDIMVLLAGLQGIPDEPVEAAIIDGAGWFSRLRYVVLPLLKPAILVVLLIRLADAIRIFDVVYVLTGGGPGDSTEVFSTYIFRVSFTNLNLSQGAAGSLVMVLITALMSFILSRRFKERLARGRKD